MKIIDVTVKDIRFPTSLENLGTDSVHIDCDYSATYVEIITEDNNLRGIGLTFTIGKGNDLCVSCINYFKEFIINKTIIEIEDDIYNLWLQSTNHSQLRWIGPEKGVVQLSVAAFFNALWDLISKFYRKPLWKYIIDLKTENLLNKLSFTYLDDILTKEEAHDIIENKKKKIDLEMSDVMKNGFPSYTTAAGWLGYSDNKMINLTKKYLSEGWTHFKMKVGQDIERDIHRCKIIREIIGKENFLMIDANQVWSVKESIKNINLLKKFNLFFVEEPTSPDDILGFKKIKNAIGDVKLATGEMCQNRIVFKQFLENKSLDFCQIDSCRLASLNEIIPIMLIASKLNIPIIPHAGGVGLCEYVQHINIINKLIISNNNNYLSEYADSCSEHILNPAKIYKGNYITPQESGYSAIIKKGSIKNFEFTKGDYWNQ